MYLMQDHRVSRRVRGRDKTATSLHREKDNKSGTQFFFLSSRKSWCDSGNCATCLYSLSHTHTLTHTHQFSHQKRLLVQSRRTVSSETKRPEKVGLVQMCAKCDAKCSLCIKSTKRAAVLGICCNYKKPAQGHPWL